MTNRQWLACGVCGLTIICATALNDAPAAADSRAELEAELKDLLKQRLESAEFAWSESRASYDLGTITLEPVIEAAQKLAAAQLALLVKPAEELEILGKLVERLKELEEQVKKTLEGPQRGGELRNYHTVRRERLSAEVSLLNAKLNASP